MAEVTSPSPAGPGELPAASLPARLEHRWLPAARLFPATPAHRQGQTPSLTCGCGVPGSALPRSRTGDALSVRHQPCAGSRLSQLIPLPGLLLLLNLSPGCLPCPALPEPAPGSGRDRRPSLVPAAPCPATIPRAKGPRGRGRDAGGEGLPVLHAGLGKEEP